jgi:hypothetical protein
MLFLFAEEMVSISGGIGVPISTGRIGVSVGVVVGVEAGLTVGGSVATSNGPAPQPEINMPAIRKQTARE